MFGIGEGPSSQEKGQFNLLNSTSQFATGLGQGNLTLSSEFFRNLLTDPMKALAPEISAGQEQVQQQAKTNAEFGNRGGGTNASTQAAAAQNRANIINLMGSMQSGAAGQLASTGSNLLSQGMQGAEAGFGEAKTMQEQSAQSLNDLLGGIISTAGGIIAGLPGGPGGLQDVSSNLLGAVS